MSNKKNIWLKTQNMKPDYKCDGCGKKINPEKGFCTVVDEEENMLYLCRSCTEKNKDFLLEFADYKTKT